MTDGTWVKKELSYDSGPCQFIGRIRDACAKCVEACPRQALHPSAASSAGTPIIELDPDKCDTCGDCAAICPTGALARKLANRQSLEKWLAKSAGKTAVLCESKSWIETMSPDLDAGKRTLPDTVEIVAVDGLGFFSETDFAIAVDATRKPIVVFAPDAAQRPFAQAARLVGHITERLYSASFVCVITDAETFWRRIGEIAQTPECSELPALNLPPPQAVPKREHKRKKLRFILEKWIAASKLETKTKLEPLPHPAFATIKCKEEECILCGACANQCKVEGLEVVAGQDASTLVHSPIACLNCGVCIEVCPAGCLSSETGLLLDATFLNRRQLASVPGLPCAECGEVFTTTKRARMVAEKIRKKKGNDPIRDELLSLCPECRAKRALFTHTDWVKARESK